VRAGNSPRTLRANGPAPRLTLQAAVSLETAAQGLSPLPQAAARKQRERGAAARGVPHAHPPYPPVVSPGPAHPPHTAKRQRGVLQRRRGGPCAARGAVSRILRVRKKACVALTCQRGGCRALEGRPEGHGRVPGARGAACILSC